MSADVIVGIVLLAAALVVLVVTTAAETGIVSVSRARIRAFAKKGLPRASTLDGYVQERRKLLGALAFARSTAVVLGIAVGTFLVLREAGTNWTALAPTMGGALLAVAVLEAVPRLLVSRSPERWGLRLVPAMSAIHILFGAPARLLELAASAALRLRGTNEGAAKPPEEDDDLLRLVELHESNGMPENGELAMIRRIAQMVDRAVREIMVPRIDMVTAEADAAMDDVLQLVMEHGYSRIPLYEETVDNIVGVAYAKDMLTCLANGRRTAPLKEIARRPYFVPEGKRIDQLLAELREHKVHMAIVVDEYGGTAGLVTIEDVLEEIVGEIQDEYDREEAPIQRLGENEVVLDARVSLDELNELLELEIEGEDFDTVGGFVYQQLGRMPAPGDEVRANGLTLRVLSILGHRIKKVRIIKEPAAVERGGDDAETP